MDKTKVPREFELRAYESHILAYGLGDKPVKYTVGEKIKVCEVLPETEDFPEGEFREWLQKNKFKEGGIGRFDSARWGWNKAKGKT